MTRPELAHLQTVLETKQTELEDVFGSREALAIDRSADMLDQIQHASERDMAMSHLERESARLREVQAALRRIDQGTFGICLDCEEEISQKRLAALPWTESCLGCREAADRNEIKRQNPTEMALISAA